MRDPKRINRILKLVGKLWKKYPDLRLGQLLGGLCFEPGERRLVFLQEDDVSEGNLMLALKKGVSPRARGKSPAPKMSKSREKLLKRLERIHFTQKSYRLM